MENQVLLIKPASSSCNMRCKYCFYTDLSNARTVGNYGMMRLETLEALVRAVFAETTGFCSFGFQGGEPTLAGLEFFRTFIALEKQYNTKHLRVAHSIQTNGLLLDDQWAEFFREHKFLVGLSIDADKSVHDALRLDAAGKGTHNRCLAAARLLKKHNVEFNILSVVTKWLASHPDKTWQFYRKHDFQHVQLIPCIDETFSGEHYALDAKTYGRFLCRLFDLWYADYLKGAYISVRTFDNYIRILAGYPPENCAMAGVCCVYALVEADGGIYPCDFYATDAYLLGNIHEQKLSDLLQNEVALGFSTPSHSVDPACKNCEFYPICRGGCRRDREVSGGALGLNQYCASYKQFFSHALPRLVQIARRQR